MIVVLAISSYSTANLAFAKAKVAQPLILALQHVPTGTADLRWSSTDHTLVVTMTVSGLAPNSTHPATLQQSLNNSIFNCNNPHHAGKIIYNLNVLKADKFGNVTPVSTTIPHVSTAIPDQGWYIAILDGSQSSQKRIACGDIVPGGIPRAIAPLPNLLQSKQENLRSVTFRQMLQSEFCSQQSRRTLLEHETPFTPWHIPMI